MNGARNETASNARTAKGELDGLFEGLVEGKGWPVGGLS